MTSARVPIVLAADAFAYLPIQVLWDQNPTCADVDGIPSRFRELFDAPADTVMGRYLPQTLDEPRSRGDLGCLNAIKHAWDEHQQAAIGVCDVCEMVPLKLVDELVVVGSLISRPSFWCIVDSDLADAKFPEIPAQYLVIHEEGYETGYVLGKKLYDEIVESQVSAPPTIVKKDFDNVVDEAIWLRKQGKRKVAAVTASVLSVALANEHGFSVSHAYATDNEFKNFLTTGIVVHRAAIDDPKFRSLVETFLGKLNWVIKTMHTDPKGWRQRIITLANGHGMFEGERQLEGDDDGPMEIKQSHADLAHQLLSEGEGLYSNDLIVVESQWRGACLGERRTSHRWPALRQIFNISVLRNAMNKYDEDVLSQFRAEEERRRVREMKLLRWSIFSALCLVLFSNELGPIGVHWKITAAATLLAILVYPEPARDYIGRAFRRMWRFKVLSIIACIFFLGFGLLTFFVTGQVVDAAKPNSSTQVPIWVPPKLDAWIQTNPGYTAMTLAVSGVVVAAAFSFLVKSVIKLVGRRDRS